MFEGEGVGGKMLEGDGEGENVRGKESVGAMSWGVSRSWGKC